MARHRLALMMVLVVVAFAMIGYRLVQLQVVGSDRFQELALAQRLDTVPIDAERGSVFDRNGNDLAISVRRDTVWANPQVVSDPAAYAAQLSPIVGVDEATLVRRLADRDRQFVYVARAVEDSVSRSVSDLNLAGIDFVPESRRYYPAGDLAAPVLGMVGTDNVGLGGLEYLYEDTLAGTPGELVLERDRDGRAIPRTIQSQVTAERGTDLVLTIDESLQYSVEQSLSDQVSAVRAAGGTAMVVDIRTGGVLAMASVLSGDDGIGRPAPATERNRVLTDPFEPGSTNKVVTFAAALDAGVVGPSTGFEVPDWINVADATFTDSELHPTYYWSTRDCLVHSSNVCTIQIAQALGKGRLDAALRSFGFGTGTAIDFPGESDGILRDPDVWYGTGLASAAIGYGLSVTPAQMLNAYVTVANGGVSRPTHLVQATIDGQGKRAEIPLDEGERVVSPDTAAIVTDMLTDVVASGTGSCAAIPGYTVAGKTGTARKLGPGGYSTTDFYASFAGFAPAEDPAIAAVVVIDDPEWAHRYGGLAAAPVFAEIMQFALRLDRIPPPVETATQWDEASADLEAQSIDCTVPHGGALDRRLAEVAALSAAPSDGIEDDLEDDIEDDIEGSDSAGDQPDASPESSSDPSVDPGSDPSPDVGNVDPVTDPSA